LIIGFSGAHRTGKTTLAREFASVLEFQNLETNTSKFLKDNADIDVCNITSLHERIKVQKIILGKHIEDIKSGKNIVTDRTPIDMLAYTLGELTMNNAPEDVWAEFETYRQIALEATSRYYDIIFVTQPLPSYEQEAGKPKANLAYQWQIQYLIQGIISAKEIDIGMIATILTTDRKARLDAALSTFRDFLVSEMPVGTDGLQLPYH
jgi:DNA polymerase III gamma/tau subunit